MPLSLYIITYILTPIEPRGWNRSTQVRYHKKELTLNTKQCCLTPAWHEEGKPVESLPAASVSNHYHYSMA